jgi:hypothetical protein
MTKKVYQISERQATVLAEHIKSKKKLMESSKKDEVVVDKKEDDKPVEEAANKTYVGVPKGKTNKPTVDEASGANKTYVGVPSKGGKSKVSEEDEATEDKEPVEEASGPTKVNVGTKVNKK